MTTAAQEETITRQVLHTLQQTPGPRTRAVMEALVRHLHAFVREVEPTDAEWMAGVEFLTATGKMCSEVRQEFILLSDALGVTTLVDVINHRHAARATPNSVQGPFFSEHRPAVASGSDISGGAPGTPMYFAGRILDGKGVPVVDAEVDIWHADGEGLYDIVRPGHREGDTAMRALLRSDEHGRFRFRSVLPAPYPIPDDGPVGAMMRATARSRVRPAHVHVAVTAKGFHKLTTMLFVDGDDHLATDPVFGVRKGLARPFIRKEPGPMPDGIVSDVPFHVVDYDFHLAAK